MDPESKKRQHDIEVTEDFIIANIKVLPEELLLQMVSFLPKENIYSLCQTDRDFSAFCAKFNLTAASDAIKEIQSLAPYAEVLDTPQKQLAAIKAWQETVYTLVIDDYTWRTGLTNEEMDDTPFPKRLLRIQNVNLGFMS